MYTYFNNTTLELVALMPSNRGRLAANHTAVDIGTVSVSVALVPAEKLGELETAAAIKDYVTDHGPAVLAPDAGPGVSGDQVLNAMLKAMREVLTYDGTTANGPAITGMEKLERHFEQYAAQAAVCVVGTPAAAELDAHIEEWRKSAAKLIVKNRTAVNTIMLARAAGWRAGVEEVPNAGTSSVAAVPTAFGFARLSGGEAPKLSVVSGEAGSAVKKEETGVFWPTPDATYITSPQIDNLFRILELSSKNAPQNANLIGPHGCGKTELAIQFAARHKRPLLIMDCANLREARDWFGYKTAKEGTVYWHESQFVRAVQAGNHVVLLDELNRANPNLLNTLMPLLDGRRFTYLEERGDKILVGPGTVFFASMNEGAGYTGTSALDRAVRDRFPRAVELSYLGESDEVKLLIARTGVSKDIATRLVQMANKIRVDAKGLSATLTESMSTRQLLAAAADFAIGGVDTLQFTVANHFSPDGDSDSERLKVQSLIQGKFGDIMAAEMAAKKGA